MGLIFAEPMSSPFSTRWDPRKDAVPCDFGWIGEDEQGVFLRVAPQAAISAHPEIWRALDEVVAGGQTELTRDDWDRLSAYEHAAKRVLVSTVARSNNG